jgi:hypothetical protein
MARGETVIPVKFRGNKKIVILDILITDFSSEKTIRKEI